MRRRQGWRLANLQRLRRSLFKLGAAAQGEAAVRADDLDTPDVWLRAYAERMNWYLHFLGTGAAHAVELGSSSAVLERDGKPLLLIDCGPDTWIAIWLPTASRRTRIYITHTHMDHVGGLERLFTRLWFNEACVDKRVCSHMPHWFLGCRRAWPITRACWPKAA